MFKLALSLQAWGTPAFKEVFRHEVEQLSAEQLPLQQGLSIANYVSDVPFSLVIHSMSETESSICVHAGIFYQGVLGGCSCTDDPTPASDINEYCEVRFEIARSSALTTLGLLA